MHSLAIPPLDRSLETGLRHKIDNKTKPPGSLGRLEELALQIGLVRGSLTPTLNQPHLVVFAGDHGAARSGISAFPQEVTWQMVENFLAGGAAINVFARANGIALTVVDAGVAHDFGVRSNLVDAKVGVTEGNPRGTGGTASYLDGAAMTAAQRDTAMARGTDIVAKLAATGCEVIGFGEMGIGNTASAALLTHCLTDAPLDDCVGRGTGLDDTGLARKKLLLRQALSRYAGSRHDALAVLAQFGGFEIAMMTGAMLAAARQRMLVLVDGFICGAAALVAARLQPAFLDYAAFCHASAEAGHRTQLAALNVAPLMSLDLRLGEGTGAALAWPLVRAACAFLNEMASFESANVSDKL
ncbi:MAG: nicotinate-nucleotide--dimethylbenzimidazole phosphoribosyltransferase [Gammaproteobacteria bacterium]|nr:nicotinate-nucleotide--dimethylbenzimidazole phosphoribosyltransferase [Rhodocyclaceae bacterium]MBU3909295.1 nicotinate-nucleotide--dimethylbenzimidazole phosphoribosyltransferase [Gammaproteobacteria bacterium]MBU3990666.1 nicotinate-nucleotide--dimethylbenzimidazole phosphoribosyltransferase [Gammaproteobacteria bacterium]MBU4005545.1 nicotinate-nucleotide--dimethylbenzimidazole phosphoribosyltransferase [Gammaproteobacteria bacterium]MBU4020902.1 nicotinate-nucleotide--dimethylbenzimidaz